jgi:cytochrome c-L
MFSIKNGAARMVLAVLALMVSGTVMAECKFESTKADHAPLVIKATDADTPEAKEFLATCVNPYTKKFVADPELAKQGKKKFGLYSCTQCHGGDGQGQTGPALIDDLWQYSKHVSDKGMFETIAGGSDLGMPTWHQQLDGNPDLPSTDEILKIIGWVRASFKGKDPSKPWLNDKPCDGCKYP